MYGVYYRPQRSCGKVMFLHLSVILFTGGCLPQCMLGNTPLRADTPRQTPPWQTPHPPTVTAADGTHPTGMFSCYYHLFDEYRVEMYIKMLRVYFVEF